MSWRLSKEIANLATEARHGCRCDHEMIEKLTLVVGYGHLVESNPSCWDLLRKHLLEFIDLTNHEDHPELREHSAKILEISRDSELEEAAANLGRLLFWPAR